MGCEVSKHFSEVGDVTESYDISSTFHPSLKNDPRICRRPLREDFITSDTVLGKGANGQVKTCSSREDGQVYALKRLSKKGNRSHVQDELFAHLQMEHRHIASLHKAYDQEGELFLVMELCHGGEVFDRLRDLGRFPEALAARVTRQLLEAVEHIHSLGFVHTDIKLENVLFESKDNLASCKLIDFGFCKPCTSEKSCRSKKGTLGYMAPEVLQGKYGQKCDLFSLGVVAYSLLCGKSPFGMSRRDTTERRTLEGAYTFQQPCWDGVSDLAKDFVSKLLEHDQDRRMSASEALRHPWLYSHPPRERVWSHVPPVNKASKLVNHPATSFCVAKPQQQGLSEASTRAGGSQRSSDCSVRQRS